MHISAIIGLAVLSVGVIFVLILRLDRRWYKSHPGAEEKFVRIDDKLTSQGR